MKIFALIAVLTGAFWFAGSQANAQCGCETVYAPVVQPTVVYRPVMPATTYYAPPAPAVVPAAYYTTRFRPRRAVTRVQYGYAPAYTAYYPVW